MTQAHASPLPIDSHRAEILSVLSQRHLVVQAATGSGKSTRLPLWARSLGRVLVIQPRRLACVALAQYLAEQLGSALGAEVGYAIRFDQRCDEQTQVVFVTPGVALRWLSVGRLQDFACVMLDEFHERRWDTDLLLALLKVQGRQRLLVTSATLHAEAVAGFLDATLLQAKGRQYPVSLHYASANDTQMPEARGLVERVVAAVDQSLQQHTGDVLVFLPGRGEIERCRSALARCDAEVLALFAQGSEREHQRALSGSEARRVILATNVAETSLTLPDIAVVIDSGLERRTHQRNGRTVLSLHPISAASAQQRSGRAGRLGPGHCVRLWGRGAPLGAFTPPEVLREELTELVLAAAAAGYPARDLAFVDPLPEKSLQSAEQFLIGMRAVDDSGHITAYGRRLFPLPIDAQFAHLISAMHSDRTREAMVDLVAGLSFGGRWYQWPQGAQGHADLMAWQKIECDAVSLVYLLRERAPLALCQVDARIHSQARELSTQLRQALQLPPLSRASDFDRAVWLQEVLHAMPSLAYVRREKRPSAMGNGYVEVLIDEHSRLPDSAQAALVFDVFSVPGRGTRQTLNRGSCLAPLRWGDLRQAGLGEAQLGQAHWQDEQLQIELSYQYAGRVIERVQQSPQGAMAREALTQLVLNGRLLAPAGETLARDCSAYALYIALGEHEDKNAQAPEAAAWLRERLAQLGVQGGEDMALIEPEDLRFAGIPDWQRAEFDQRFPLSVALSGLLMQVHYQVRQKCVTLVYQSGPRKADPKRWELPRWAGWRVKYQRASRVIDVR